MRLDVGTGFFEQWERAIQPLKSRVMSIVARTTVLLAYRSTPMQRLQVQILKDELSDEVEHFQPYGFTSAPMPEMEALVHFVSGDRSHAIASVVTDASTRPQTLAGGDVAIYHLSDDPKQSAEDATHRITLTAGRLIIRVAELDIKCGRSSLKINDSGIFTDALDYEFRQGQ